MKRKPAKKHRSKTVTKTINTERIDAEPKLKWFGWLVLIIPMSIVLFLSLFEGPPWVAEQSALGALAEATQANTHGMKALKAGRYKVATGHFHKALQIDPDNAEAYTNLGILFNLHEDCDGAIRYFQKALQYEDENKELIYNNIGMIYGKKNDHEKALKMFEQALTAGVKSISIYRNIGALCMTAGDFEGAIKAYKKAIEYHPTLERSYDNMLIEVLRKFDTKEAERDELYRAALETIRNDYESGSIDVNFNEYDTLIVNNFLNSSSALNDDYRNLGAAYNKIGIQHGRNEDYEQAIAAFEEAVKYDPRNKNARQNLEHCKRQLLIGSSE